MSKLRKFIKDERGGSGAIIALIFSMMLILIFFRFSSPIIKSSRNLMLQQAMMKGIDKMQQNGGLTQEIENSIIDYLKKMGFNENDIEVNGTVAPVLYGQEIVVEINYSEEVEIYKMNGLLGIEKKTETNRFHTEGSTTSYYYDNN